VANVGYKISNPGFDATKAAGYQLLYNSSWPTISITYESSQTVPYVGTPNVTFTHNLGYFAFCDVWVSVNGDNVGDFLSDGSLQIELNSVGASFTIRQTVIASSGAPNTDFFGNVVNGTLNCTISIKCYNIDLTKAANYPFMQSATYKQPYSPDVGIKLAKPNRNIASNDLRDFILHSRGQSPTVLAIQTEAQAIASPTTPGTQQISYSNPAGYVAWVYGFVWANTGLGVKYYSAVGIGLTESTDYPSLNINGSTYVLNLGTAAIDQMQGGTLLVLRDPLFAANTVNVTV
jgi:hypothetical protein